jgi:hypothetical protein
MKKLIILSLLSTLDLAVAGWLVTFRADWLEEANPLLGGLLISSGWPGLLTFKLAATTVVLLGAARFGVARPWLAAAVLVPGSFVITGVTGCACLPVESLVGRLDIVSAEERRSRQIEQKYRLLKEYRAEMKRLSDDLISQRISLAVAVEKLGKTGKAQDEQWLRALKGHFDVDSAAASLGCDLIQEVRVTLAFQDSPYNEFLLKRLKKEYRWAFGAEPVLPELLVTPALDRNAPSRPARTPGHLTAPVLGRSPASMK